MVKRLRISIDLTHFKSSV